MLLETSSASAGQLVIRSDGTLQLDTSANNTNVLVNVGSGNMNVDAGTLFVSGGNDRIGIGTTSPSTLLHVRGAVTGQTLINFDEIGDRDILTASKSGTPRLTITRDGNIKLHQASTIYTIAGDLQLQTSSGRNDNIVIRTYDSAASTANGDDIFIAAQDNLYLGASSLTLETTSSTAGQMLLRSDGSMTFDTSGGSGSFAFVGGNVGTGTTGPQTILDILGQCVARGTRIRLRRRKRQKKGKRLSVFSSRLSDTGQPVFGQSVSATGQLITDEPGTENGQPKTDNWEY